MNKFNKQEMHLDFNCPQYMDFTSGLDYNYTKDTYFDGKDDDENTNSTYTFPAENRNYFSRIKENRFRRRMAISSVSANTPKVRKNDIRRRLFAEDFLNDLQSFQSKSAIKVKKSSLSGTRLYKSKTVNNLSKTISDETKMINKCKLHKKPSMKNSRLHKNGFPVTPMCLKRTAFKAKAKLIKSTEELELEKIAELRKQLILHLRHNEMTLKKMKMRPKPRVILTCQARSENVKENNELNTLMRNLNLAGKEARENTLTLDNNAVRSKTLNCNNTINEEPTVSNSVNHEINSRQVKCLPSVSNVDEKVSIQGVKKAVCRSNLGHSGLVFIGQKNTPVKYFSFEPEQESTCQNGYDIEKMEVSTLHVDDDDNKENISSYKP